MGTRSKGPTFEAPEDGNKGSSRDIHTISPTEHQQIGMQAFTLEQNAALGEHFAQANFVLSELIKEVRLLRQEWQTSSSSILPSIETSTPALPTAPSTAPPTPPPRASWNHTRICYRRKMWNLVIQIPKRNKSMGITTLGPVVNAGKHAYYLNVSISVDRPNKLKRK